MTIDHVDPDPVDAGVDTELTVYGKGIPYDGQAFVPECAVYVDGVQLVTTWVHENMVTAQLPGSIIGTPGTVDVVVRNPSAITSGPVQLTVTEGGPAPTPMAYGFDVGVGEPTGPGQVRFESIDQANPSTIWLTFEDLNGDDRTTDIVNAPAPGAIRLEDQADPAKWNEYVYSDPPVAGVAFATYAAPIHWNVGALLVVPSTVVVTFRPYP